MGTFLSTNLWMNIRISHEATQQKGLDEDGLIVFLKEEIDFQPDIYQREDTEKDIIFQLKPLLLEKEFISFLEAYYGIYYENPQKNRSIGLLKDLRSMPSEKWAEYIEQDNSDAIFPQDDNFSLGNNRDSLRISVHYWRLTMEGKVMTEGMDAHLRLFTYSLKKAFKEFSIAQALDVTLLG